MHTNYQYLLLLSSGDFLCLVSRYLLIVKRNTRCKCPEWTPNQKCWTALFRCHDIVTRDKLKTIGAGGRHRAIQAVVEHQLRAHLPVVSHYATKPKESEKPSSTDYTTGQSTHHYYNLNCISRLAKFSS